MEKTEGVGKYISFLYRNLQSHISKRLEELEIGPGQYMYLFELDREDGVTQDDLGRRLLVDKGTVTRAVKKLERVGYVRREVGEEDRRVHRVFITERGKEIVPELHSVLDEELSKLLGCLDDEEISELRAMLKKIFEVKMDDAQN